jgi:hypothetical protein
MRQAARRTEFCLKQAEECAAAAAASALVDVKAAYLNLEQGWLQLAPELAESANSSINGRSTAPAKPSLPISKSRNKRVMAAA